MKKNFKKNSIILVLITLVVLFFVLREDFPNIVRAVKNANILYIVLALFCFFLGLLFEARAYQEIIEEYDHKYSLLKAYRMLLITKFFNGITPFSSGGQPMQVYMLKKDGIRLTKGTNIIVQNFIIYQAALVMFGIFAVTLNHFNGYFPKDDALRIAVTIGFIINTLVMIGLIIISFSNKFNHFILNKIITILSKLRIVKNKEKALEKWNEKVDDFYEGTEYLKKNKWLCVRTVLYNVIYLGLIYLMPYFVILAINNGPLDGVTPIKCICSSAYVLIVGAFVPLPGATGGIELGFSGFFGKIILNNKPLVSASLLIWRTISYYLPMIIGGILFNIRTKRDEK